MNWKSTVVISGVGLVGTWLMSSPAVAPIPAPALQGATPTAAVVPSADIQREADRLAARVHTDGALGPSTRNPFQFAPEPIPSAASVPSRVPDLVPSVPIQARPSGPRVTLVGVASDVVGGTEVRRAILSADGVVTIASAGDEVAGQFLVEKVDQEVVDLQRTSDGTRLTLTLGH